MTDIDFTDRLTFIFTDFTTRETTTDICVLKISTSIIYPFFPSPEVSIFIALLSEKHKIK